jgi:hypothetical protein
MTTKGNESMINKNSTLARLNRRCVIIMAVDADIATVRFANSTKVFKVIWSLLEEF